MRRPALTIIGVGRVVAKFGVLDQMPDHIDAEAVDALAKPEPHHLVDRLAHLRDCASSDPAAGRGRRDNNIVRWRHRSVQALPPNSDSQLFGAPPSGFGSRHRYQSRFGLSRELRLSMNQGCWSEVWFGTRSRMIFRPASCAALPARRNPPWCRTKDRCRYNRRCRSRNRPSARETSATARSRRSPAPQIGQPVDDTGEVADPVGIGILKRARIDLIKNAVLPPEFAAADPSRTNHPRNRAKRDNAGGRRPVQAARAGR